MKILHLISSGGLYGAEAIILNLCEELDAGGVHQAAIGVFAHPDQPLPRLYEVARERGIEAHSISCRGPADRSVPAAFRALAERTGADLIHTHGYKADIYAAVAWRGRNATLVSTCHTWYDNDLALRIYGAVDRWVLRRFDGVVAVTEEVRGQLLAARVPADRVRLIRNGVASRPFLASGRERQTRTRAGAGVCVGLVGRLAPEKGVDLFLQAAKIVIERAPGVSFVIAGEGPDRAALELQAKQLGLQHTVTFLGRQEDMSAFYASIDVLASSSRQEGLPVALLEGMASGLPLVATRVGAVPEVVADQVTGYLVDPEDAAALAEAMLALVADPERRMLFGAAGQGRVKERFSATRMTADYLESYAAALARRKGIAQLRTCTP